MTIPSDTRYEWRIDITRKHIKIGECRVKSCTVDFVEDAEVTRTMKAVIPKDGFITAGRPVQSRLVGVFFDGTRMFNGTWSFFSAYAGWDILPNDFDMFSDRLRPVVVIDGDEYNFGDFMVIAAPVENDGKEDVYEIEAYDETMILKEAALTERKYYQAGTQYLNIINALITDCGLSKVYEDATSAQITIDHEYAIGTTYLDIINELLDEIGYSHIYAGADGYVFLTQKTSKSQADYAYTDQNSTITDTIKRDTDIYTLPNVIIGYVSSPDIATVMRYSKVNDDPKSVISTVRRGYNVVEAFDLADCPDLLTLQQAVDQRYLETAQATEKASVASMPDGNHPYGSYISLGEKGDYGLFREIGWSVEFGGVMTHELERKMFV